MLLNKRATLGVLQLHGLAVQRIPNLIMIMKQVDKYRRRYLGPDGPWMLVMELNGEGVGVYWKLATPMPVQEYSTWAVQYVEARQCTHPDIEAAARVGLAVQMFHQIERFWSAMETPLSQGVDLHEREMPIESKPHYICQD